MTLGPDRVRISPGVRIGGQNRRRAAPGLRLLALSGLKPKT